MARYVTTPIFYVNAAPHLGHAYTVIASDVFARHWRQRGEEVFFLTGTDEHGEPVALAAEKEGVSPQELADRNAAHFVELAPQLNAATDFFIRTSDARHVERVQEILTRVKDNGFVEEGTYEGWYCPRCADFKTETEIVDGNRCPIHKIELTREQEHNWFFKLSAFEDQLKALFDERTDFVIPARSANEARAFIDRGLHDVSLSRANLRWGVDVPWDPEQVFYVWWDALLNYVTALSFADETKGDQTAKYWPADFHVIGKDILKFHAIYWPALLMAAGLEVPRHVLVHGFLLMKDSSGEEHKMSKSLGNVLDPFEIIDRFGADALRFYLLREVSFGQDGAVSVDGFVARYESELANDFGNLASRSASMVHKYRDGVVPAAPRDAAIVAELNPIADQVAAHLDAGAPSQALEAIWSGVRRLNQYVDATAPWKLAKDDGAADQLDTVLVTLIDGVRALAVLLHPYLPATTERLLTSLAGDRSPDTSYEAARLDVATAPFGHAIEQLQPLFPKER